jgi:hypothetical protein
MHPTALHHRQITEDVGQRLPDPASAVDHAQHATVDLQSALEQIVEQRGAQRGVLGRAQPQAQHHFAPVGEDSQRYYHGAMSDLNPVDH